MRTARPTRPRRRRARPAPLHRPAGGGDCPATPANLRDPLVLGDLRRRRRCHIDNLAPLRSALLGPSQRGNTAPAALRLDLQSVLGVVDEAPRGQQRARLLAGLAPDLLRDERFFAGFFDHGASDDGGRDEFDESQPSRRSSSATRCVNAASMPSTSSCSARNTAFAGRNPSILRTQHGVLRSELLIRRELGHDDTLARPQHCVTSEPGTYYARKAT